MCSTAFDEAAQASAECLESGSAAVAVGSKTVGSAYVWFEPNTCQLAIIRNDLHYNAVKS